MRALLVFLVLALSTASAPAQTSLASRVAAIAAEAKGQVSVDCALPGTPLDCALHPHAHPPMQSVFKFPLGMAVLAQVDAGKLQLDQPVPFTVADRMPGSHSPMQDTHTAPTTLPLRDMLRYMVSDSDNVAADILMRLTGGPDAVQRFLSSLGITNIRVLDDERGLSRSVGEQYLNWAEPAAMVSLLRRLADRSPLSSASTAFLNDIMEHGSTGPHRLRGLLPPATIVAHKTGSSGTGKDGVTYATNDVGLITLPDGRRLALAVFVTDSQAGEATRERVIAASAQLVYTQAVQKH